MPSFGRRSMENLRTCHNDLQIVGQDVVLIHDCTVLEGHRGQGKQDQMYYGRPQRSKVKWPNSYHNAVPSDAFDLAPWFPERGKGKEIPWPVTPTNWNDKAQVNAYLKDYQQWAYFAGIVIACAAKRSILLTWGGDWDRDHNMHDQSFDDLPHFQRVRR